MIVCDGIEISETAILRLAVAYALGIPYSTDISDKALREVKLRLLNDRYQVGEGRWYFMERDSEEVDPDLIIK